MVVQIEVREVALTVLQHNEDLVVVEELTQQSSVFVVIQTVDVWIIPHLSSAECRMSVTLQADTMYRELRQQIAFRRATLDHHLREVLIDKDFPEFRIGFERHLDDFCLAVGVGAEVHHLRARRALRQIVLLIARHRRHVETLDEAVAFLAVAIDCIIGRTGVVLLENVEIEHVFAHKHLLSHTDNLVFTVFVEDDDVIDIGAVADELVLLQTCADEAVRTVDVEFLVGFGHLRGLDGVEIADLRQSRMILAVFVLEELEPVGRHLHEVRQIAVYILNLCLQACHQLFCLVFVEFQDALHLDFQQFEDVILGHFTDQGGVVGRQSLVDMLADGVDGGRLFEFLILIDAFFDEDLLQ